MFFINEQGHRQTIGVARVADSRKEVDKCTWKFSDCGYFSSIISLPLSQANVI